MLNHLEHTDVSFIVRESSAVSNSESPTTARTDTLAEYMRNAIVVEHTVIPHDGLLQDTPNS